MLTRRIVYWLFIIGFLANLACLLISISAAYISPHFFWPPAVMTLFFRVFLITHLVLFMLLLLFKNKRLSILAAAAIILCIPAIKKTYAINFSSQSDDSNVAQSDSTLKLMSYNVHSFAWHEDTVMMYKILQNIRAQQPDILCLQEYYIHPQKHKKITRFLRRELGLSYYYEYITDMLPGSNKVGLAIFSKYPFHNFTPIRFERSSNGAFYADFKIGDDTVRVINVHFQSVALSKREYAIPGEKVPGDPLVVPRDRLTRISLLKFRSAFRKRSYQVDLVKDVADSSPYKVILCGDFNDIPTSYLYRRLTEHLDDTYLETNFGIGATFAGRIPGLRIDYILADPDLPVKKTWVVHEKAGDHYPLVSLFDIR
jgi:endonuclease/exonuclease/phosphatase family metal-dependent hydrolase